MSGQQWTLNLTCSRLPLSLNDRRHRMVIYREQVTLRDQVRMLARQQRIPRLDRIHVQMHWTPAVRRVRDRDNTVATLKSCLDGLRDFPAQRRNGVIVRAAWIGVVPDDDPAHVDWSPPIIHDPDPNLTARLRLVITDRSNT